MRKLWGPGRLSEKINEQVSHVGFCRKAELYEKLGPEMQYVKRIIDNETKRFDLKLQGKSTASYAAAMSSLSRSRTWLRTDMQWIERPCVKRGAFPLQSRCRHQASHGCTKSSTMASGVIARKIGERVKLYSRPGNDLTYRFPLIVEALAKLRSQSCIIDGEAVACGDDGIASFNRIRHRHHDADVFMWAFDLIELNGDELRRDPLNVRKATLGSVLARAAPGLRLNEHLEADGPAVFHHACMLGLEGIVSKRKDSQYRSLAALDQEQEAVKREAEEETFEPDPGLSLRIARWPSPSRRLRGRRIGGP